MSSQPRSCRPMQHDWTGPGHHELMCSALIDIRPIAVGQTHPLRSLVLRPGQPLNACLWEGDDDCDTVHWGAYVDGSLAAIATVMPAPIPGRLLTDADTAAAYRLRGMATHPEHRGRGLGTALLRHSIDQVCAGGGEVLWCNARTSAADFYRRQGFATIGDEFTLPDIGPHVVMWIDTRQSRPS